MSLLHIDFESRSALSLPEVGLDRYVKHKTTRPLMMAWALDENPINLWQPHVDGKFCSELQDAISDPHVTKVAWNSQFERNFFQFVLRTTIPYTCWLDPMILARHLSLPGYLEDVSLILGLTDDAKMSWGTKKDPGEAQKLINKFCVPCYAGGEETLFGVSEAEYRDWDTDPVDWARFCEYCKTDIAAERSILRKLASFPLPETERKAWILDQKINDRGVPMDLDLVRGSTAIAVKIKEELTGQLKELTGLANPNSRDQMLAWLKDQGYTFGALAKGFVNRAMNGECDLTDKGRRALELRKQASKTSDSKLDAILANVGEDGRLRHQFAFMGAPRTGRWAGHDFQPQNLPTPTPYVKKNMDRATELLRTEDFLGLSLEFPSIMDAVTGSIRPSIKASEEHKLVVADESAIENRIVGWLARCEAITQVFRDGKDPYLDFAARLYGETYEQLYEEFKAGDKSKRTNGKPASLGCGFGLGGGEEYETKEGDILKGGLWGYAHNMGVPMSREDAHKSVAVFREAYPEVVNYWYALEEAAINAIKHPGTKITTGQTKRDGEWIAVDLRVTLECFEDKLFRMTLPSGRGLHYVRPRLEESEVRGRMKLGITCEGKDQKTKQWGRTKTYGSRLFENLVQAIARDVLVNAMFLTDDKQMPIVLHVHDEIGCELPENSPLGLSDLVTCLKTSPLWAPDLLLGAEGYEAKVYRKD